MTEEVDKRLRETADRCVKAYDVWSKAKRNAAAREELMDAIHELRKVGSRIEIELAVSDRDEMTSHQIPIPPHRASRPRPESELTIPNNEDMVGNGDQPQPERPSASSPAGQSPMRRRLSRTPRPGGEDGNE